MTLEGDDTYDPERKELNSILDLLRPEELVLILKISKLIYNYKSERLTSAEPR
jgi:hypothetical protein